MLLPGDRGVIACDAGRTIRLAATSPVRPRDTTGAGDVFLAAFVHAERLGAGFESALALATAAAGLFLEAGRRTAWPEVEARARIL